MLRSFLIYLSQAAWARKIITGWAFAWRSASRFVAGEKLEDAIRVVKGLNDKGINATLDHLGEHTTTPEAADRATLDIMQMLDAIEQSGIRSNVSIKLTQIGAALDQELCTSNLRRILSCARERNTFVRIDMEDSPWTETTLQFFRQMVAEYDPQTVGAVIQAYLYRSQPDIAWITQMGGRVRLCKGAYKEPEEIAYPRKAEVDRNYDRLASDLIDGALAQGAPVRSLDGKIPPIPGIASHDPLRIEHAKSYALQKGLPQAAIEFQMLNGIRRDLQEQLAQEGYPVRVYVPFGTEWYPYFVRRLAERPANLWFFLSNLFRK